ncbi:GerAB/ArcD/ProY family transporter [Clostridium muellerianum]|nr:endospore germination permease [Clostridium muellerianum]
MEGSSSEKQNLLTKSQFACITLGTIVGTGIIALPNGVVKVAHQDGWISAAIGGIYPLYIVIIWTYVSKAFPNDTILGLSKKYFGNLLGSILNLIFSTYFMYFATMGPKIYINLMRNFGIGFLTPLKMISITFLVTLYASYKGLKVLGKISEITFVVMVILMLSSTPALKVADIENVPPLFDVSLRTILQGSITAAFAYSGAEIMVLICPFVKEKNKIFSSSLISVFIVISMYVWTTFITIYYLGPDIVNKSYWSFLLVSESVTISLINNYRYIFIFLWTLIAFRACAINCYASIYILKDLIKKINIKKLYLFIYPLFVYVTFQYGNEINRQQVSEYVTKVYVIFNVLYITIIAIITFFKRSDIR